MIKIKGDPIKAGAFIGFAKNRLRALKASMGSSLIKERYDPAQGVTVLIFSFAGVDSIVIEAVGSALQGFVCGNDPRIKAVPGNTLVGTNGDPWSVTPTKWLGYPCDWRESSTFNGGEVLSLNGPPSRWGHMIGVSSYFERGIERVVPFPELVFGVAKTGTGAARRTILACVNTTFDGIIFKRKVGNEWVDGASFTPGWIFGEDQHPSVDGAIVRPFHPIYFSEDGTKAATILPRALTEDVIFPYTGHHYAPDIVEFVTADGWETMTVSHADIYSGSLTSVAEESVRTGYLSFAASIAYVPLSAQYQGNDLCVFAVKKTNLIGMTFYRESAAEYVHAGWSFTVGMNDTYCWMSGAATTEIPGTPTLAVQSETVNNMQASYPSFVDARKMATCISRRVFVQNYTIHDATIAAHWEGGLWIDELVRHWLSYEETETFSAEFRIAGTLVHREERTGATDYVDVDYSSGGHIYTPGLLRLAVHDGGWDGDTPIMIPLSNDTEYPGFAYSALAHLDANEILAVYSNLNASVVVSSFVLDNAGNHAYLFQSIGPDESTVVFSGASTPDLLAKLQAFPGVFVGLPNLAYISETGLLTREVAP